MGFQVLNVGSSASSATVLSTDGGIGAREISGTDVMPVTERTDRSCRITLMGLEEVTGVDRRAR